LLRLSLEHREVLLSCTVSGFEPAQGAAILGISDMAARLARTRAKLRERLEPCEEPSP
jgi:DNA-directed RNA polymerase specialized sigma24 family protein